MVSGLFYQIWLISYLSPGVLHARKGRNLLVYVLGPTGMSYYKSTIVIFKELPTLLPGGCLNYYLSVTEVKHLMKIHWWSR